MWSRFLDFILLLWNYALTHVNDHLIVLFWHTMPFIDVFNPAPQVDHARAQSRECRSRLFFERVTRPNVERIRAATDVGGRGVVVARSAADRLDHSLKVIEHGSFPTNCGAHGHVQRR